MNLFHQVVGVLRSIPLPGPRSLLTLVPWGRLAAAVAFGAPVTAGVFALARPDLWMVERVVFEGNDRATVAELRHLADLPNGTAPWAVDTDAVASAVARHPWVREATAELSWPDQVTVHVTERRAAALLHDHDQLLFVDEQGVPFLRATGGDLDFPHLTGMGSELDSLHPDLAPRAIHDALWLVDTLDREGLVPRERVSEVAFRRTSGFLVHTGRARIAFGPGDLPSQVERLSVLVHQGISDRAAGSAERLSLEEPRYIDLAPATVAIVRRLDTDAPTPTPTVGPPAAGQGG